MAKICNDRGAGHPALARRCARCWDWGDRGLKEPRPAVAVSPWGHAPLSLCCAGDTPTSPVCREPVTRPLRGLWEQNEPSPVLKPDPQSAFSAKREPVRGHPLPALSPPVRAVSGPAQHLDAQHGQAADPRHGDVVLQGPAEGGEAALGGQR